MKLASAAQEKGHILKVCGAILLHTQEFFQQIQNVTSYILDREFLPFGEYQPEKL